MSLRRSTRWLALVVLLIAVVGATAVGWAWWLLHQPYRGHDGDVTFEAEGGQGATAILGDLEQAGVLADARLARFYLIYVLGDPPLLAGEYRFERALSTPAVLDQLIRGAVVTYPVTLIEGLTLEETAAVLADAGLGDLAAFRRAMADSAPIADLDPDADDLEGYLFPDTYHFARGTKPDAIVATLVRTFRQRFEKTVRPALTANHRSKPIRDIVTLASVVEKEAQLDDERPTIAGVYANRLRQGIALYADPTVIYALKRAGQWDGNLTKVNLKHDSPYNTYLYAGLPPGPICSPGLGSLVAAAAPADVPFIYFVSRNDGSHVFARTLREHQRNVDEWQKRYWRRRWAEERADSSP